MKLQASSISIRNNKNNPGTNNHFSPAWSYPSNWLMLRSSAKRELAPVAISIKRTSTLQWVMVMVMVMMVVMMMVVVAVDGCWWVRSFQASWIIIIIINKNQPKKSDSPLPPTSESEKNMSHSESETLIVLPLLHASKVDTKRDANMFCTCTWFSWRILRNWLGRSISATVPLRWRYCYYGMSWGYWIVWACSSWDLRAAVPGVVLGSLQLVGGLNPKKISSRGCALSQHLHLNFTDGRWPVQKPNKSDTKNP